MSTVGQIDFYQSKNGLTLTDGFYWVANRQRKYISIILIQNKTNSVTIFNTPARMSIAQFIQLEALNQTEILERISYPKKVLKFKFN